jgi:hypothetical protein
MITPTSFDIKIKNKIINELNQDLYRSLNLSLYEADHYFGYYNGYIHKLIDRVYKKHGPWGLRKEIKYIIQYLNFLFNKLEGNFTFPDYILVVFYFRMYYRHFSQRQFKSSKQLSFNF